MARKLGNVEKQEDLIIDVDSVRSVVRKLSNWKAPDPDGVVGFWFKKVSALHDIMASKLQLCLASGKVPLWMVKGRTLLIQKDPKKEQLQATTTQLSVCQFCGNF